MQPSEPNEVKLGVVSLDLSRLSVAELQQLFVSIRTEVERRRDVTKETKE